MVAVADVAAALGGGLLRTLVSVPGVAVTDVVIAEPGDRAADLRGDLVVGAGVADAAGAVELVEPAAAARAAGVILRRGPARARGVRAAAKRSGVALLELADSASLVHAVGVIQGIVDRASAPDAAALVDPGGEADLLALADAAAALVNAPVTIEDAQSRVLAYSTRQDVTDTARVSTVLGRRVPASLVAHMRSRGVFRRLARSDEPFLVPPGPGQEMPRYVVPVRVGGEWLGSIWAVVDTPPPDDLVSELRRTASVVALHLLRNRALADLTRRLSAERLRTLLSGGPAGPSTTTWLPPPPWRAVVLGTSTTACGCSTRGPASASAGVEGDLDIWESRFRRWGWRHPLIADLDDLPYALVTVTTEPRRPPVTGSWAWLSTLAAEPGGSARGVGAAWVAAGVRVAAPGDLAASARSAAEVAALRRGNAALGPAPTAEEQWATLTVRRAIGALAGPATGPDAALAGPVAALAEHDRRRHTAYLVSLAAWLDHPGEPTAAAKTLGVHVNTLRHRMVRMSEVAPLRLDDPTERLALRLQLAVRGG
ncbi:MAG: helix-turn-helix domain-containing protein [Lapillicoccus sp.]